MKKILFAAAAVVALASCATDEVISRPDNKVAIEFDNAFVNNSTRAATDLTLANLQDFGVYGTVAKGGSQALIFDNTKVSNNSGTFTYSPAQYWVEDANYTFSAFAPFTGAKWAYTPTNSDAHNGSLSFDNAAALGEQDLIFASTARTTNATLTAAPAKVNFTFGHLLSKVAFKYTNSFTDGNITLNVYDVKINNAAATGTVALTDGAIGAWAGAGDYVRSFGLATAAAENLLANGGGTFTTEHFYLIPVEREYNITFKVDLIQSGVLLKTYAHTVTTTINLEKGKSYSINAALTPENVNPDPTQQLYPIEFDVIAVEDWVNAGVAMDATTVADANALATAVAAGGNVRLTENITLPAGGLSVNTNAFIDLNGYTLTVLESNFVNNANLIISNGTISGSDTQLGRRAIVNKGNLTMNNVTVAQVYAGGGSAINNDGTTAVAELNNVTVNAQNMAVSNKNGAKMTINGGNFVGNGTGGSYAIVNQLGSTMTINGGTFEGGHGVVSSTEGSVTTLNGGTYHCTCTYTGNSDWVLFAGENSATYGAISYNAANCKFTTARADSKIWWDGCASYITSF